MKFSRPVSREVTSKDVKYAIERAFTATWRTATWARTSATSIGAPKEPGAYKPVEGIETPDDQTIVFKLSKGTGAAVAGALSMPISIPVPKEYAQKFDKENPSTYGQHQVVHRPVHDRERRHGNGDRLRARQAASTSSATPTTRQRRRLPPGVPRRDRHPGGQRRHRRSPTRRILSGESMATGEIEPPASQLKRLCRRTRPSSPSCPAAAGASSRWTRAARRSTTSTCARRSSPASTASPPASSAAARRSARSPSTTSRRAWRGFEESGGAKADPGVRLHAEARGRPCSCRPSTSRRPA